MDKKVIESHSDLFGSTEESFFAEFGFKSEKEMLTNIEKVPLGKLKQIVHVTLLNFDYSEEEYCKIVEFLYRKIFD